MLRNSGNILILGPNEQELNYFKSSFKSYYNVFTAESVKQAHQLLQDYDIHLVLVNQHMEEMTGIQFCESIKQAFPHVQRIVLTESSDTEALLQAVTRGQIYRYIKSPYELAELKMTIDGALQLSTLESKNRTLQQHLEKHQADRKQMLSLLEEYVPQGIIAESLDQFKNKRPDEFKAGEARVVSLMHVRITQFNDLTGPSKSSTLLNFLKEYRIAVTRSVKAFHGTMLEVSGEHATAVFGAPVSHIHNHRNAVFAGLHLQKSLDELRRKYAGIIAPNTSIGIGIHTDSSLIGKIDDASSSGFEVLGEIVDVAAAVAANPTIHPASVLITQQTRRFVSDYVDTGDIVELKRPQEAPIAYCEVTGRRNDNIVSMRPNRFIG